MARRANAADRARETSIAIVGCGKAKAAESCAAGELYTGGLFRATLDHAIHWHDRTFIVSARYGLLEPSSPIAPYDETLKTKTPAERAAWARKVAAELAAKMAGQVWNVAIYAGADYARPLIAALEELPHSAHGGRQHLPSPGLTTIAEPMRGLTQGRRLQWLAEKKRYRLIVDPTGKLRGPAFEAALRSSSSSSPRPTPAPAPAIRTPHTRLEWEHLGAWVDAWDELAERRATSAKHEAQSAHLEALPDAMIEAAHDYPGDLTALEKIVRAERKRTRSKRPTVARILDAIDRARHARAHRPQPLPVLADPGPPPPAPRAAPPPPRAAPSSSSPPKLRAIRAKNFAESGDYLVIDENQRRIAFIYRDPESREWHEGHTDKHYTEVWLGSTMEEALATLARRGSRAAPSSSSSSRQLALFNPRAKPMKITRAHARGNPKKTRRARARRNEQRPSFWFGEDAETIEHLDRIPRGETSYGDMWIVRLPEGSRATEAPGFYSVIQYDRLPRGGIDKVGPPRASDLSGPYDITGGPASHPDELREDWFLGVAENDRPDFNDDKSPRYAVSSRGTLRGFPRGNPRARKPAKKPAPKKKRARRVPVARVSPPRARARRAPTPPRARRARRPRELEAGPPLELTRKTTTHVYAVRKENPAHRSELYNGRRKMGAGPVVNLRPNPTPLELRPHWIALRTGGKMATAPRELTRGRTGVYAIREAAGGPILYIGEAHVGDPMEARCVKRKTVRGRRRCVKTERKPQPLRWWKTITRHLYPWEWHYDPRDPRAEHNKRPDEWVYRGNRDLQIAIWPTTPGQAKTVEGRLILEHRPKHSRKLELPIAEAERAELEDAPF